MTLLRHLIHAACFAAAASILPGCAAGGANAPAKDGSFSLAPGDSLALSPGVTLHFERVADSRCPPGAKCIWAGKLAYQFTLTSDQAPEAFELSAGDPRHVSAAVPGMTIALAGASAAPPSSVAGSVNDAPVSLAVTGAK